MKRTTMVLGVILALILVSMPFTSSVIAMGEEQYYSSTVNGMKRLGVVVVNFTSANGIPDEDFVGILTNVNATFYGDTQFAIAHPLFPIVKPFTYYETSGELNVRINFLYGRILYHENTSVMIAYSWTIYWTEY